ncbi:MAG: sulfite exporter TauE/SafE family protein [Caldilinea sp. CFX5]|nr:sulfite exporter TauE/SafE family protein [Caldilinea sp. CFX5]
MLTAFLLGLTGSFGHCVGMCSGVSLLLSRKANITGWRVLLLHAGRLTTYGVLGALAGGIGLALNTMGSHAGHSHMAQATAGWPTLTTIQGVLALLTACIALYMALALVGHAPSPEVYLRALTQWWGQMMRRVPGVERPRDAERPGRAPTPSVGASLLAVYSLGLLWGLLPCGLVLAALLTAAVAAAPLAGALTMVAFGLGTWPVGLSVSLAARWPGWTLRPTPHLRSLAAVVILAFGLQMALRGLAAWGVVGHLHLGGVMVW